LDERPRGYLPPAAVSGAFAAVRANALRVEGPFTVRSLSGIRQAIADQATYWCLSGVVVEVVQTISSELAANIVAHAEGDGRLVLSYRPGVLHCQAIDRGPGMPLPFLAGWQPPDTADPAAARGLWTVRMLSARMQIDSSALGTTVTTVLVRK
jgi:anti-sigma regulatory factor (Ser/Thr protein kinase)